jgi:hypothetical protein
LHPLQINPLANTNKHNTVMATQTNSTQIRRQIALVAGALVAGNQLFASGEGISAGEILLYISLIVGVILAAWFLSSGKTPKSNQNPNRPHFDHPNDPHFRRLRKKTS